jgi:hypothetical protein
MKSVRKEYKQPFLIEPTKLTRLIDKIHERLADHPATTTRDTFEVFLAGNRHEELTTLEQVFALDNSRRQRIKRLLIVCSASSQAATRPDHEVEVDFASPKISSQSNVSDTKVVAVSVRSDAAGWASRTLSEVEEQVERTWLQHNPFVVILIGLFLAVLLLLASQFLSFRSEPRSDEMWLSASDFDRIEAILRQEPTLTDDSLREIATMQLRNIVDFHRPSRAITTDQIRSGRFLAVPLVVVLACIVVLLTTCYPSEVFLWGDEIERYARIQQRRKTIWTIIVGVTLVGVLSRLLFEGVASWFPR